MFSRKQMIVHKPVSICLFEGENKWKREERERKKIIYPDLFKFDVETTSTIRIRQSNSSRRSERDKISGENLRLDACNFNAGSHFRRTQLRRN